MGESCQQDKPDTTSALENLQLAQEASLEDIPLTQEASGEENTSQGSEADEYSDVSGEEDEGEVKTTSSSCSPRIVYDL